MLRLSAGLEMDAPHAVGSTLRVFALWHFDEVETELVRRRGVSRSKVCDPGSMDTIKEDVLECISAARGVRTYDLGSSVDRSTSRPAVPRIFKGEAQHLAALRWNQLHRTAVAKQAYRQMTRRKLPSMRTLRRRAPTWFEIDLPSERKNVA